MFPAGVAPAASRFAKGRASVAPRERSGAVCRSCPGALCVEARRARCYTNTANDWNWPPEPELHRPRRVFSALLISLSYLADKALKDDFSHKILPCSLGRRVWFQAFYGEEYNDRKRPYNVRSGSRDINEISQSLEVLPVFESSSSKHSPSQ